MGDIQADGKSPRADEQGLPAHTGREPTGAEKGRPRAPKLQDGDGGRAQRVLHS